MAARIKNEMTLGISDEMKTALEIAVAFVGTTASQYARQAILEKLVRERFIEHPLHRRLGNSHAHEEQIPAK